MRVLVTARILAIEILSLTLLGENSVVKVHNSAYFAYPPLFSKIVFAVRGPLDHPLVIKPGEKLEAWTVLSTRLLNEASPVPERESTFLPQKGIIFSGVLLDFLRSP